jgi:hypothetical protein
MALIGIALLFFVIFLMIASSSSSKKGTVTIKRKLGDATFEFTSGPIYRESDLKENFKMAKKANEDFEKMFLVDQNYIDSLKDLLGTKINS